MQCNFYICLHTFLTHTHSFMQSMTKYLHCLIMSSGGKRSEGEFSREDEAQWGGERQIDPLWLGQPKQDAVVSQEGEGEEARGHILKSFCTQN